MISIKNNAASEYYICFAYNDESEIIFGANEKTLTATVEKAVAEREKDISDLFAKKRKTGSFMVDVTEFEANTILLIENSYSLYTNIEQSIPLTKAEITAKEFNKSLKNSENAYQHLVLNAIWNMFRINKHLSASRLFNLKPLETCEKYAEQFKLFYKRLLTINEKKSLTENNSAITVSQEYDYTVMYARAEDFEALYARYIAELKKKKIYCRRCKECGKAVLFYSRNKLLCDSCTTENISKSKREHKLIEKGDTVLRKNKERLGIYYNYSHSAAFRKSSPEHQKWFIDFFTRYKADAKALMKQYRAGEIEKNEALAQLSEMSKEYYEKVNKEANKSS